MSGVERIVDWLMDGARSATAPEAVLAELCERLLACGVPLSRCAVYVRTLHPNLRGHSFRWRSGQAVEVYEAAHAISASVNFQHSPIPVVERTGLPLRRRLAFGDPLDDFPVLAQFRAEGFTDYYLVPLCFSNGEVAAMSWSTDAVDGFSPRQVRSIERVVPAFTRIVEIYSLRHMARNILETYLGHTSGQRVLEGLIKRGDGDDIHAVIWFCDLRGSTPLAESMDRELFLAVLNRFFEATAGAGAPVRPLHFTPDPRIPTAYFGVEFIAYIAWIASGTFLENFPNHFLYSVPTWPLR